MKNAKVKLLKFFLHNQLQINILFVLSLLLLFIKETAVFKFSPILETRTIFFLLWTLTVVMMPIKSKHSILLALLTFGACLFLEKAGFHYWALRLISYTYYFFLIGVIQYFYETYKEK